MNGFATIALAWKEFRQLLGITVAISIYAILGFLISGIMESLSPFQNPLSFFYSIAPATLTPITIAMAGAVIAVGGERQIGNWQWLTTLPVSWSQAFAVKLTIILLMAATAGAFVWGGIVTINSLALSSSPLSYGLGLDNYDYRLMLFAIPTALLWAMIMCLWLREPMIAIMVAAAVTLIEGFLKNLLLSQMVSSSAPTDFGIMAIATAIEGVVLFGLALLNFKAGWFNPEPILASLFSHRSVRDDLQTRTQWGTWSQPNSSWAIVWQSAQSQIWPVAFIGILTFILYLISRFDSVVLFMPLVLLMPCFLGLFTLAGEQTRRQFRVMADRGFSPRRYLLLRTLLPVTWITLSTLVLIPTLQSSIRAEEMPPESLKVILSFWGIALGIYFSFVLATLTFSNPLLALFTGIALVISLGYGIVSPVIAGGWLGLWISVPLTLIAATLPWLLVKRWMRYDNPGLPWISFASTVAISLSAIPVYFPLRAYSIPKLDLPSFKTNVSFEMLPGNLTNIRIDEEYNDSLAVSLLSIQEITDNLQERHTLILEQVERMRGNQDPPVANSTENPDEQLRAKLADLQKAIQTPQDKSAKRSEAQYAIHGSDVAEWLSLVIYYAIVKEDRELLTSAIDTYASIIDPRYPIEFGLYRYNTLEQLSVVLTSLRGIGSPELYAIVFDRLIKNIPSVEVWTNYHVALASSDSSLLRQSHPFYSTRKELPYGFIFLSCERERLERVQNLQSLMNINFCTTTINAMSRNLSLNASTPPEQLGFRREFSTDLWDGRPNFFYADIRGNDELSQIMSRYYAGDYGQASSFLRYDQANPNLNSYFLAIRAAAAGTQQSQ